MAAFVKSKLKLAREAISKKNYAEARDAAAQVLDYEPANYNANVFLALAALELGENKQSEQVYRKAVEISPDQPLAWQGLVKFYEKTEQWAELAQTLEALAEIFNKLNDAIKCAETLQKLLQLRRDRGTRAEVVTALALFLPGSRFYDVLSSLPPPDPTNPSATTTFEAQCAIFDSLPVLQEMASIVEKEENDGIKKEVDKRRMRLDAPSLPQIQKEVGIDFWSRSQLPKLYNEIINHPNTPDELRRSTEAQLLRHKHRLLFAIPPESNEKAALAAELEGMISGIVLLDIPDEFAWRIAIECKDAYSIEDYDYALLRRFINLFPDSPVSKLFRGYYLYMGIPMSEDGEEEAHIAPDEGYHMVLDAFGSIPESLIAHRILAEVYQSETDHENAIRTAESGLELVRRAEQDYGKQMAQSTKAFNVVLATALVALYPPKHHARALRVLDTVLAQDPDNVRCLMGRGYVLQHVGSWEEAAARFGCVMELVESESDDGLRAREEHAWCLSHSGDVDTAIRELLEVLDALDTFEDRGPDQARCWWRLGQCRWKLDDAQKEEAYRNFITALKRLPTFAPAFTALGVYYSQHATPADPHRASKCFQKAFELDAREAEAARRLAEGFADERDWDLVDVVARRTIEGEGVRADAAAARYLPTNAWAWKALGVVELSRRNYPAAIQALQTALRALPEDQVCWLRLGEAYGRAGRYAAAVKALAHAQELAPDDWVCAYFIGDVQRQTGMFGEAIDAFAGVLAERPDELAALIALAQTHLELGQQQDATGFLVRAEESFLDAVRAAVRATRANSGFRHMALKIIADACFCLASREAFSDDPEVRDVLQAVLSLVDGQVSSRLAGVLDTPYRLREEPLRGRDALECAMVVADSNIALGFHDDTSAASIWADFSVAVHKWAITSLPGEKQDLAYKQAISAVIEALRIDSTNDAHWNSLGAMYFLTKPKIAQHAYIRALEIDNKNPATWTNLGLLYLQHGDLELANEALYKAQILDPDYTLAWVGQGLVATANGHDADARALFEHIITSLPATAVEADLEYASRAFTQLGASSRGSSREAYIPAFFALDRYCKRRPQDASALHLLGLVCERIGHVELATELAGRAITILEAAYEDTEDAAIERRFVVANATLGRLRVARGEWADALAPLDAAQGLMGADDAVLRVQCLFGAGHAHFGMGRLGDALEAFQAAVLAAEGHDALRGQAAVLLAQALWALGTPEGQEGAKTQLLQCIASDPENLLAINTLAGMGVVSDDAGLVDAALSEILALPLERRQELDPGREVPYLLIRHHLGQGDAARARAVAQEAVFAEPARAELKRELAALTLGTLGDGAAADALLGAEEGEDVEEARRAGALRVVAAAAAGRRDEARRMAMKAVMMAPAERRMWEALAVERALAGGG